MSQLQQARGLTTEMPTTVVTASVTASEADAPADYTFGLHWARVIFLKILPAIEQR